MACYSRIDNMLCSFYILFIRKLDFSFFFTGYKKIELIDVVVLAFMILLVFLSKSGLLNALNEIANRKLLLSNNGDGNSDSPNYNLEEKKGVS